VTGTGDLDKHDKSIAIAKGLKWRVHRVLQTPLQNWFVDTAQPDKYIKVITYVDDLGLSQEVWNLYEDDVMFVAWDALNQALTLFKDAAVAGDEASFYKIDSLRGFLLSNDLWGHPDAMTLILDRIYELLEGNER
jgi:hypothetical protein